MESSGYAVPKGGGIQQPYEIFRRALNKAANRNVDPVNDFNRSAVEYLRDFIMPTIRDCPPNLRADYKSWTEEFNFALSASRLAGVYVNRWAAPVKPANSGIHRYTNTHEEVVAEAEKHEALGLEGKALWDYYINGRNNT